jgi:NIMA-interacting peptidyl-prolyl cis-trans isomerase 4
MGKKATEKSKGGATTTKKTTSSEKKESASQDGKLKTCKEVKARHILCEKMGKSEEVMKILKENWLDQGQKVPATEFAKLAQQFSDCSSAKKGGDLGWFGRGKMVGPFQDAAFSCQVGDIATCKSAHGYHIILVEGRRN